MKNKKVVALLLATVMMVGCFTGCGQQQTVTSEKESQSTQQSEAKEESKVEEKKEPVTLEWYYAGNGTQQDTQKVEDYVNELLKEYEGLEHVTLHLNCFTAAEYKDKVLLAQTSGKQIDMLQTYRLDYNTEVKNGTFLALDDYLAMDEYAELKSTIPSWLWDQVARSGSIYVVPVYQIGATTAYFAVPNKYLEYVDVNEDAVRGFDINDVKSVTAYCDEIERITLAVREKENTKTKYCFPIAQSIAKFGDFFPKDVLDSNSGFMLIHGDGKVSNIYLSDAYKEACRISAKWVEEGLLPSDATVRDDSLWQNANILAAESYAVQPTQYYGEEDRVSEIVSGNWGADVTTYAMYDQYFFRANWGAGGTGITSACKNPDEAMKLIDALNTEKGKEIYNALVYGLEGVHYERIDENHIKTLEYDATMGSAETKYAGWNWVLGNTSYGYLNQGYRDDEMEVVNAINNSTDALSSILMGGFLLDLSPVSTEIAQCTAVVTEYHKTLAYGAKGADWEAYYNEFIAKMETAGVQKVLDYMQEQVDAFLSTK